MKAPADLSIRTLEFVVLVIACCFVLRARGVGNTATMLFSVVLGGAGFVAVSLLRDRLAKKDKR